MNAEKLNLCLEKLALLLCGAFALAFPFLIPALAPLHFVALVPWIVLFVHPRYQANSAWVWLGSFIYLAVALRPYVAYHIVLPVILALLNFVPIIVFPILLKRLARLPIPLALSVPSAWVVTEWIRVWASARQLQMYFLGSSQVHLTKIIQIADLGGVYAVSFVVASVSGLVAEFFIARQKGARLQSAITFAAILAFTLTYGFIRDDAAALRSGPTVAVMQPGQSRTTQVSALDDFTRRSLWPLQAEMVVWPENAISDDLSDRPDDQLRLAHLVRYLRSYLLAGSRSSAYLLTPEGKALNRYDKIRVMFWSDSGALQALLLPGLRDGDHELTIFELPRKGGILRFATPIGLEITDLKLWRDAARQGADFLVNLTTEGKVGRPIYEHLLALSTFQAVENRMGVIRAANDGLSAFIDPNGRVRTVASVHERAVLIDKIQTDRRHGSTVYSRVGDLFVVVCAMAMVIALGVRPLIRRFVYERVSKVRIEGLTPLVLLVVLLVASSAGAAQRQISPAKKKLIRQLLEVTDAQEGTADAIIDILGGRLGLPIASEEQRGEVREGKQVAAIAEETQISVYDRHFTEKQLRDLITFFKTKSGRHYVEVAREIAAETRKNLRAATTQNLDKSAEAARDARTRNDLQLLGLALSAYFGEQKSFPKAQSIADLATLLTPKYAPTVPQQDAWGHVFRYEVSPDGQHYRIVSAGRDGNFESSDDIVFGDGRFLP